MGKKCVVAVCMVLVVNAVHAQKVEFGVVTGVDFNWKTVTLSQSYNSMVVICTPNYNRPVNPFVIRVTNATGNSFQLLAQSPGAADPVTPIDVHYLVVEEGVYNVAQHGVKMEAVKFLSTVTAENNGWGNVEMHSYQQSYANPVVVGQVMTAADPLWSVFWSSDGSQANPPSPTAFAAGKHVGEDTVTTRLDEIIGYIVIEAGAGIMGGQSYVAGVGPDTVEMIDEAPSPWTYTLTPLVSVTGGVFCETAQDGGDGSWAVLVGNPPFGPGTAFLAQDEDHVGDRDTNHANDQIAYIAFGTLPAGTVSRKLEAVIARDGVPYTVQLEVMTAAGGQLRIDETVPAGLTPTNFTGPGTTSFAGGVLTWTVDLVPTSGTVLLTYDVTPAAGPDRLLFSGTATDVASGVGGLAVTGQNMVILALASPPGVFDWNGDIGVEPVGQATGNPSLPGSTVFDGTSLYTVGGAGADVWGAVDRCQLVAKEMSGSYVMDAYVNWIDPGDPNAPAPGGNNWSKAGVMIRAYGQGESAQTFMGVRNPINTPGQDVVMQWRDGFDVASAWTDMAMPGVAPTWVRIIKLGNTFTGSYFDTGLNDWVVYNTHTNPGIDPAADSLACLFVTSHDDDSSADPTVVKVASASFDGVVFQPIAITAATRSINRSSYALGRPVPVAIDIIHSANASITVTETIPPGWTAMNISDGGTQVGNVITWNLSLTADIQLTYDVMPAGGAAGTGVFDGIVTDTAAAIDVPIAGDTQISRLGALPIIYILDQSAGRYPTQDANVSAALGASGLDVGGTLVPGLGYPIREVDQDAAEEAQTFTTADGVCILVSETVGSAAVWDHVADPIPIVMNEQALMDDRDASTGRCSMHFSEGNGAGNTNQMNITDNTHPITSIFATGLLTINAGTAAQISLMQGLIATDAQVLALSPLAGAEPCLAVFNAGVSGLMNPDPQDIPTPDRRVGLGFHQDSMTTPTVDGVYLYQRAVQWAINGNPTAGTPAPTAPIGLTGTNTTRTYVDLTWTDTSNNENGFVIARREGATGPFIDIGQVGFDTTTFQDLSSVGGMTYTYHVRAFNPAGESGNSNDFEITIDVQLPAKSWNLYR